MKSWDIDDKTRVWSENFNAGLETHKAGAAMDALRFQPSPRSALLNHDQFVGFAEKPLMVIANNGSYKIVYIAAIIALIISMLLGIYLFISVNFMGRSSYQQVIWPVMIIMFAAPTSLIFGPIAFYYTCRRILFFDDHMVFARRNLAGCYKAVRIFYYKDLQKAEVCREYNDTGFYWAYVMTFQGRQNFPKMFTLSDIFYENVQAKMTFWQNNMVWRESDAP